MGLLALDDGGGKLLGSDLCDEGGTRLPGPDTGTIGGGCGYLGTAEYAGCWTGTPTDCNTGGGWLWNAADMSFAP